MPMSFRSLHTLQSIRPHDVPHLTSLGINNLSDLLAFQPIRIAMHVRAAAEGFLRPDEILPYLDNAVHDTPPRELLQGSVEAIRGVGQGLAASLLALGIRSIAELADYPPFTEAEELLASQTSEQRDPFAPACVLPTCRKFTRNSKSFVSFFRQEELRNLSVRVNGDSKLRSDSSRIAELFNFSSQQNKVVYLGYSVSFLQEWVYGGVHLGEPQGSVNLFMGQDTQVSVLDWRRAMSALRSEDTRVTERLSSTLFHQRAVDEVARATAEEHQFGATSAFGANAATAGSFIVAGAVVGGVGGGISGALIGAAVGGVGTVPGAIIGTVVGSIAGAAAGSLIVAGATTLGFVETDARGVRDVFAASAQNIQQHTVQNSSSLRSFWSNIISQSVQEEQQTIRTDRVTNHNRIHALNALYFEVLNEYRVTMQVQDHAPILFLPFKPFYFNEELLRRYWWLLRTALDDKALVLSLDTHFLALRSDPSPAGELAELPAINDIETNQVVVEVNLDGSAMRSIIEGLVTAAFVGVALPVFYALFDASKRDKIEVRLVTTDGTFRLTRDSSPNADPNFVGRYRTDSRIPVAEITGIEITNANPEFVLSFLGDSVDVNELAFEAVSARLFIRNRASFSATLPTLGSLEDRRVVRRDTFRISSNSDFTIPWDIADRLRDQFEGVDEERTVLEGELASAERVAARIANLIGFLNANKFGFTRFILQNTEREQVISVLEGVRVGGVPLSTLAATTPIGFCGNHVVLPLRSRPGAADAPIALESSKLQLHLASFNELNTEDRAATEDFLRRSLRPALTKFIDDAREAAAAQVGAPPPLGMQAAVRLDAIMENIEAVPQPAANATGFERQSLTTAFDRLVRAAGTVMRDLLRQLQTPPVEAGTDLVRLEGYFAELEALLGSERGRIISSDAVSLPSPAIFMEPVLSNAKGAELYDMRRNSHYEILPAPAIGAADPNVIRSEQVTLTPNVPGAILTIQAPPNLPLPNSIGAALAEAGKLDLSGLISSNAETLTSTLGNLASMATELAKASAALTGEARENALAAASDVARQVNEIVAKSLVSPTPSGAPTTVPAPPRTQQEKAEVNRELERITAEPGTAAAKAERKRTIGASVLPAALPERRSYQMSILFVDADGLPYPTGSFRLAMTFFELGRTFPINNGDPIQMQDGEFLFADLASLQVGRRATLSIDADIALTRIAGILNFTLPDRDDVVFLCRMLTETRRISQTDVTGAMDEVIRTSSFGGSVDTFFTSFLNGEIAFPFRIFEVSADGSNKSELNLRAAYNRGSTETDGSTTTSTTVTEFEVVLPRNGWSIDVS